MKKASLLASVALAGLAFGAHAQLPGADSSAVCDATGPTVSMKGKAIVGSKSADLRVDEMLELNTWLTSESSPKAFAGAGFTAELSRQDQFALGMIDCADCKTMTEQERRYLVGVSIPVGHLVDFTRLDRKLMRRGGDFERGALRTMSDGGFVWTTRLQSPGAAGLRISLSGLDLPSNAGLYVFNDRGEAFGPYLAKGGHNGEVTTNMVSGDVVYLQLRVFGASRSLAGLKFEIDGIGHISDRFRLAAELNAGSGLLAKTHCTSGLVNADCVENAECYSANTTLGELDNMRKAIAAMLYASEGQYYICTGGLIANDAGDPLFLTANHCLSSATEANTLETYWNHTAPCGTSDCSYAWTTQGRTTEFGAQIMATNATGDFTLLKLATAPPAGAYQLGWTNEEVAFTSNVQLHRISHPNGTPQAYSEQQVNASATTCRTLQRGDYIYSTDNLGATEGGSSGSPVVNAAGLIVGQLFGACGSNTADVCDSNSNGTVDGALAAYFPQVEGFLVGGGGGQDPAPGTYTLIGQGYKVKGRWTTDLAWSGTSNNVDIYREGSSIATNVAGSSHVDSTAFKGSGSLTYQVCDTGTTDCSNEITVSF